jgi:hypothetical protein
MNELSVVVKGKDWRGLKALVLDSVSSSITKRFTTSAWMSSLPGALRSANPASRRRPWRPGASRSRPAG